MKKATLGSLICCAIYLLMPGSAHAETSPWFGPLPPYATTHASTLPPDEIPTSLNGRCTKDMPFVTRPANYLQGHLEQTIKACATQAAFGIASGSRVLFNDAGLSGTLTGSFSTNPAILPIPYSPHVLYQGSGAVNGYYAAFIRNLTDNVDASTQADGSIKYRVRESPTFIKNAQGDLLSFLEPRFSDNGKWMVSDSPYVGMTRINVETGETLTFGPPMNYNIGLNPRFAIAISADGRYAAFSEHTYELFRIYDLSTCAPAPDLRKSQNCQWKDLLPMIRSHLPAFKGITSMEFSTNTTLRFTALNGSSHGKFTITAGGESESLLDYLATGDSFASGEGAYSYKPYSDIESPFNKCHLSVASYPFLVAATANLGSTNSVACSGAKIKDIYSAMYTPQAEGKNEASFSNEIYQGFLAGYRPQSDFIKLNKPRIITTSIGGNDIGFAKILASCVMPGTCYSTPQEQSSLSASINAQLANLSLLYRQLKQDAATSGSVFVIGYPEMVDPTGSCALNVHLNQQELLFANKLVHTLNNVIQQAATSAGISYIDTTSALAGHRLCETKSSDVAVNGLTLGDDKTASVRLFNTGYQANLYLIGRESYHPNRLGHKMLAEAIGSQIKNTISAHTASSDLLPNQLAMPVRFDETPSQLVWTPNAPAPVRASNFAKLSTVAIYADSSQLASASTDSKGQLSTSVQLPHNSPHGLQTIRFLGVNHAGQPVEYQKQIYNTHSETDADGDGVTNEHETCSYVIDSAGQDTDKDGLDDACDGYIGEAPISVEDQPAGPAKIEVISPSENIDKPRSASTLTVVAKPTFDDQKPRNALHISNLVAQKPATLNVLGLAIPGREKPHNKEDNRGKKQKISVIYYAAPLVGLGVIIVIWWRKRT